MGHPHRQKFLILCGLLPLAAVAQQTVTIQVDSAATSRPTAPVWNYFGYDEPNNTYSANGQKLIHELAALSPQPIHIRTHFLLASANGKPGLKWGFTNVFTLDNAGHATYDWTLVDKILDTYVHAGAIPFVEIGFMPQALSTHPDPYSAPWVPGAKNEGYYGGWTYPPNNYDQWRELIYNWVRHSIDRYGRAAVEKWDWEVWNEPDIAYWHGTPAEYDKLYDYAAAAVKHALPTAHIGGPASTGPANPKAATFLRQFLEHCSGGKNEATGQTGAPLDFITYHAKGRPQVNNGQLQMGLAQELKDVDSGIKIIQTFPQFAKLPIVLSEADPEGCAACSARFYPQNAYRNGTLYASYEAAALKAILELKATTGANLKGILTWAFEFEDQPYFDGYRDLATNGVDKPVLNFFRMAGHLSGAPVSTHSSAATPAQQIVDRGAPTPIVDALATRSDRKLAILVWNYQDPDAPSPDAAIQIQISGLPTTLKGAHLKHFRIDQNHSNAYTAWKQQGSPQSPTPEQQHQLEQAGQLDEVAPATTLPITQGSAVVPISLPIQSLSLLELTW